MSATINGTSPYVSAYDVGNISSNALDRISAGVAITSASDNSASLAIATEIGVQKSTLSQSVSNMNNGIAMGNIAQGGISEQQKILEDIRTKTIQAMNGTMSDSDRSIIKNEITNMLDSFDQIAETTTYNGETLLKTSGDVTDDLSIAGDESIITMSKADTMSISDTLRGQLDNFVSNPSALGNMLNDIDTGITNLSKMASEFGSSINAFESSARNYMSAETQTAYAQTALMGVDYAKEVSDFNKGNLLSQIGYIVQSQANASQNRVLQTLV
jgi:flagellin